jgi:hypothetical protein
MVSVVLLLAGTCAVDAAEVIRLTAENYAQVAPPGKESDAIVGDYVLRNDRIVAVVANTVANRKANMTTPRVAGCVIDLTRRDRPNDQLTAYYPGALNYLYTSASVLRERGQEVALRCETAATAGAIRAAVTYTLRDGDEVLHVVRELKNAGKEPAPVVLSDSVRADTTFSRVAPGSTELFWVYDHWFGQAYGIVAVGARLESSGDNRSSTIYYEVNGTRSADLEPGQSITLKSAVFPADHLLQLQGIARRLAGHSDPTVFVRVRDGMGKPIPHAEVLISQKDEDYGRARTFADGTAAAPLPEGEYRIQVRALARGETTRSVRIAAPTTVDFELSTAPMLSASITDERGGPIPCKLEFQGLDGAKDPDFGPTTQAPGVKNLYYSHDGKIAWPIPAGKYRVSISHGPEYDLVTQTIEMTPGKATELHARLVRTVQTPGWVSADIHTHSTPSGDNTTDMTGRVLNHLAEHIEFAPCTEHNRLDTYLPILEKLGCRQRLATCTGMELTGQPLPLNHQNAFPLVYRPGLQDNGAPETDSEPEVQIRRLAEWDDNSDKLVQTNHPDFGWMFFDRDGNGTRDAGFYRMFAFQDVFEVWGNSPDAMVDESILAARPITARKRNDRLFNWLQLLNQGYRIVGVGNTDAHYTDHGCGWIRNYVKSSADAPEKIDTMEMVRQFEAGHVVVTNGPYLEVVASVDDQTAIPGDTLVATAGKLRLSIRAQCANWLDVNRVQVLVNGRADPRYNFTRKTHATMFGDKVIRFDRTIDLELKSDSHLIVVAVGEGLNIGNVYGAALAKAPPTAFCNPIFVDVDGGGFQANGDSLDHPLPVKQEREERKEKAKLVREKAKSKPKS